MGELQRAAGKADKAAQSAANNRWFERGARVGFVANGLVHLILGVTAVGLALGRGGESEQSGAIKIMAQQPLGLVLLWLCLIGTALLALWNLFNAFFGNATLRGDGQTDPREKEGRRRWKDFLKAIGQGVAYAVVAVSFATFVSGGSKDSGSSASNASKTVASYPGGTLLLWLAAIVLVVVGIVFCVNGLRRTWKDELRTPSTPGVASLLTISGVAGYLGKGVTLLSVGVLVAVSTFKGEEQHVTGVDGALKGLKEQPFGIPLLLLVGIGLMLYGVFLALRSRYDKMD